MNRRPCWLWVALLLGVAAGCGPATPLDVRLERDLLVRQKEALERELALPAGHLESDVVVMIPARLLDELLAVALPVQVLLAERFLITVRGGRVDFDGGLALVRLDARVAWADRENVAADIEILGTLQILDIEETGTLSSRVEILGFETREVTLGTLSPPAGRLLDELARRPASDLNELLARIEIPVRLVPTLALPRVEEDELTIEAVEIPLGGQLREARVGGGRLWVYIDVGLEEEAA